MFTQENIENCSFILKPWESMSNEERETFYSYYEKQPGSIEHATANTGHGPQDFQTAADIMRKIRDGMAGQNATPWDEVTADKLLMLIERQAKS